MEEQKRREENERFRKCKGKIERIKKNRIGWYIKTDIKKSRINRIDRIEDLICILTKICWQTAKDILSCRGSLIL